MSSTEIHIGKLIHLKSIVDHQDFLNFVHNNKLTSYWGDSIEEFLNEEGIEDIRDHEGSFVLCSIGDSQKEFEYFYYQGVIYQFLSHKYMDVYGTQWQKNSDGSVDFTAMFYNGGTSLEEILSDILDKTNNKGGNNHGKS